MDTEVTRRIDDLGRIVIPKEIRKNLKIHNYDELEIKVIDDKILLCKYDSVKNNKYISNIIKIIGKMTQKNILLTSKDKIIDYYLKDNEKLDNLELNNNITELIENRTNIIDRNVTLFKEILDVYYMITPININGDVIGSLILYSKESISEKDKNIMNFSRQVLEIYYE